MADNLPKPASRKEQYLAKIAGEDTEIPEKPESRVEQYLAKIAENGGGGGGGGPTVVQTTGNSQTDVMSQDATTKLIYPDITTYPNRIGIGSSTLGSNGVGIHGNIGSTYSNNSIAIGSGTGGIANVGTSGTAGNSIAIGNDAAVMQGESSIAIGAGAYCSSSGIYPYNVAIGASTNISNVDFSVALGAYAKATRSGEVNIGAGISGGGYNSTNYRVLGGVYDGQNVHDAATVAQGNTLATSAPTTSTVGVLGQLYTDTTGMHTYQCTAISGSTYTWTQRW